jgi:hypothetical protein
MYDVIQMKSIAKQLNDRTYTDYFYRLMLIARSVFEWEGLPNGIDEKWIERYLFTEGKCMFFNDEEKGFMVTKCVPAGMLNYYDEPTLLRGYGTNYMSEEMENNEECILIRNNDEMIPTSPTIQLFALRLAEISRTIDININAQKTPVLILCSDKQKLTMKNVFKQWNGFEPVIFGDKNLDVEGVKSLKIDAPIVFPQLQIQKHAIWNECMTFLGINNANQDKRERLVTDEVSANDEQIESSAQVMLKAREQACKLINEKFGLNVSVKLRSDCKPILEELEEGITNAS